MRTQHENIRTWKAWGLHHRRWQDVVAFVAGAWLLATVLSTIAAVTILSGWLAFVGAALVLWMTSGAMQDDGAVYSWVAAAGGLVAIVGAFFALAADQSLAFWSLVIGGGVVLFTEVWSAALKRRAHRRSERRVETARPVRA